MFNQLTWMFDLQNFDKTIRFAKEDYEDCAAHIDMGNEYRRITVVVYPCFFVDNSPDSQREMLLHELCHSVLNDLANRARNLLNGKAETVESVRFSNEQATSRISQILHRLLKGEMLYAKNAYKEFLTDAAPVKRKNNYAKKHT